MNYKTLLEKQVNKEFELATRAKKIGTDITEEPEIYIARDIAEKVEGLIGVDGIAEEIRKIAHETKAEDEVALKLAKKIVEQEPDKEKAAELAVRAGLAYLTQGAVAAPLEGIAKVKIRKNPDNTKYLSIYYAGPIRAAGGTAEAMSVVLADYIRMQLGLDTYKPTQREIGRYAEEIQWYHRRVHLQYFPAEEEVFTIVKNVPICIDGEPTEKFEVANYRDLGRVETNRVRGGMCLVIAEGIAQKAPKLLKRLGAISKKYDLDWLWLEDLIRKKETKQSESSEINWLQSLNREENQDLREHLEFAEADNWDWLTPLTDEKTLLEGGSEKYIQEVPAGRPVFSYPSRKGGFGLRYGRTRASGYAAVSLNPATMHLLGQFIAIGTQIRLELPGKAAIVTPCNTINGPIVRMNSGEVLQANTLEQAKKINDEVDAILYIGDILISAGDFIENNHKLMPSMYCEEWWSKEVKENKQSKNYKQYLIQPYKNPDFKTAFEISKKLKVPLHPAYTFFWNNISLKEVKNLVKELKKPKPNKKILKIKNKPEIKRTLEKLGVFHKTEKDFIVIKEHAEPLYKTLGISKNIEDKLEKESLKTKNISKIVSNLCGVKIKDKIPTYIGARMGRPEKAKPRKMSPAPHSLFPTGGKKGRIRDLVKIANGTKTSMPEISKFRCPDCNKTTFYPNCPECKKRTELLRFCSRCGRSTKADVCPACGGRASSSTKQEINIAELLHSALKNLAEPEPKEVKGVIGMTSKDKIPEAVEKGILRAKHNIFVFKDGTIRFDSTDAPLTHFNPKEIGTSISKLKKIGYTHDHKGKPLTKEDQLLELKPQDVIVSEYGEESGSNYLLSSTQFIDDLLKEYYKIEPYYKAKTKEDLVGHLVIGLAPHTSTGIIGRIIGFTKARVGYAHPCFHDAKRRDCDGDEDAIMLLLDALLNFSRAFLPDRRGGRMDAPLVITTTLNPMELDDEVYDVDIVPEYPLSFYQATEAHADPNAVKLKTVEDALKEKDPFANWSFTHDTTDINMGPVFNTYSEGEMLDKLRKQLELAEKIYAVNEKDVAERIINTHFIPDMKGNLRTFSRQKVRCTKCNSKYRRPPLSGKCTNCGGNLTLTVHKGTIKKYLEISREMARKYKLSNYLSQQIDLLDQSIDSIFGKEEQSKLNKLEQ